MQSLLTIMQLTFLEMRRRRIVQAALACGFGCLAVFAIAIYLMHHVHQPPRPLLQIRIILQLQTLAGLYAVNLMTVTVAVMLAVDTMSGEIASGVMQTIASKPVSRAQIVLGKWLVHWLMIAAYTTFMVLGIVLEMRFITGFAQPHVPAAVGLMTLQGTVLLSIVVAGGVRLTTVANGMIAFALYSVAVVGGWIEQIGVMMGDSGARYIGTAISLMSPTDALWRRAVYLLQPPMMAQVSMAPFSPASVPSMAMVWWAAAFAAAALALSTVWFKKRAL
ncbi:MAG TPA: ABC transporter permease [Steroidobacteraceae bacterium]|jgi:ABC-type transport system involved in multi-copper enzyme maturation permease subunit|nr:ABC transporter permease [Steroidobacteraceae bacterium]